ncbi:MAG TPA: hypothetical protein VHN82_08865, partial [Methanoregula sp.]|nr:hypothetical protein [Methanoregula sp.]
GIVRKNQGYDIMIRVAEVIRGWLGWCPNNHMMSAGARDTGYGFSAGNPVTKSHGAPGSEGSRVPDGGKYEHTQRGMLIIGAVSAAIVLILTISLFAGFVWIVGIVIAILAFVLAICSTLTVSVSSGILRIRFGPVGLIQKTWALADIVSVRTVTNPWYYGWGIRWTPHGILYNVSGFRAVEVLLSSGKTFRIGTDEPDSLKEAIEHASSPKSTEH